MVRCSPFGGFYFVVFAISQCLTGMPFPIMECHITGIFKRRFYSETTKTNPMDRGHGGLRFFPPPPPTVTCIRLQQPAHNACCSLSFPRDYHHQQPSEQCDCAKDSSFLLATLCFLPKISTIRRKVVTPQSESRNNFGHEHEGNGAVGTAQSV